MCKLSICMMVKNEEKNLKKCLDSIKPLLNDSSVELVIVDTGSQDRTIEIAKEYTDKVYFHKWNNDFSAMRNISISYAKGKWIFILDADEEVENVEELKNILNSKILNKNNTIILQVKNLTNLKEKNKTAYNPSPRIFKNDREFKYLGAVHNQPLYKEPIYNSKVSLIHSGYITSDKELMNKKFIRTKTILEIELEKNPSNVYYQFQLGVSYDMHGDSKEALVEFRKAYKLLENQKREEKYDKAYVYGALSRNTYANQEYNEAIEICKEGLKLRHDYIDLYYILAMSYKCIGNNEETKKSFLKYFELMSNFNKLDITKDLSIILYNVDKDSIDNGYYILSDIYIKEKEYNKAYDNVILIDNKITKNIVMPKILLNINDLNKIKDYYLSINEDEVLTNYFLNNLENEITNLNEKEQNNIYTHLIGLQDEYGEYCNIKTKKGEEKTKLAKEFLNKIDFSNKPLFYSEIYKEIFYDDRFMFNSFKKINLYDLRSIVKYLIIKYEEIKDIFKQYLINANIRPSDVASNKVYIAIVPIILMNDYEQNKVIDEINYEIFKKYIESGINYISELYRMEKARIIYREISNNEEKFFMLMYLVKEYDSKGNIKSMIKYLKEALNCNKELIKYMEKYKEEILNLLNGGE